MKIFMLAVNGTIVSVPYRGATFLNIKTFQTSADSRRKFPSPIGELHFSMIILFSLSFILLVSVPYRGATFLNCLFCTHSVCHSTVSVPYRGATFLNGDYMNLKGFDVPVSVPYRGATFLNTIPATPCPVWDE